MKNNFFSFLLPFFLISCSLSTINSPGYKQPTETYPLPLTVTTQPTSTAIPTISSAVDPTRIVTATYIHSTTGAKDPANVSLLDSLPSGSYIVYSVYETLGMDDNKLALHVISSDGTDLGRLVSGIEAPLSISHDGRKVAYVVNDERMIHLLNFQDGNEEVISIPDNRKECSGISLTSDGKRIAVACGFEFSDIYVSEKPFTEWTNLTQSLNDIEGVNGWEYPSWSPDGRWLVYGSNSSGLEGTRGGLFFTESSCFENIQLCNEKTSSVLTPTFFYKSPTWSSDNALFAFIWPGAQIYVVSPEKGSKSQIIRLPNQFDPTFLDSISWLPNNAWIAITYDHKIFKISIVTKEVALLKDHVNRVENWIIISR